jgi:transforming growth factor-beta-induced protein
MTSIKRLTTLVALALAAVTLSACSVFEANDVAPTITDIVVDTEAVSILETAVVQEGLDGALAEGSVKYTVFAPTNDAFAQFLADTDLTAAQLLALPDLSEILLYHVVDAELPAAAVIGSAPGTVETLQGNELSYAVVDGGVVLTDATGRDVNVVDTDITAFNGVIHLIDNVLLPFGTIADIAIATDATATLEAALGAAGLVDTFRDLTATFTVFAPTEDAFAAFLEDTGLSALDLLNSPDLGAILGYHVIAGAELFAADVIAAAPTTVTTLQGGTIDVAVVDGGVVLTDETGRDINVVATDVNALNGVIHLIDYVLVPDLGE